jgi:hypothetical protein
MATQIINFNIKGELWKPIENLYDDFKLRNYFISNYGRVFFLNGKGTFREVNPEINVRNKRHIVRLYNYENKSREVLLDRLVLQVWVGGFYKRREVLHKDGNIYNNKLSNLKWKHGFDNGIDLKYLSSLKDDLLTEGNKSVKHYLLSSDIKYLYELINKNKGLFYLIFKENNILSSYEDFIKELPFIFKEHLDKGRLKPAHIGSKYDKDDADKFIRVMVRVYVNKLKIEVAKNSETKNNKGEYMDFDRKIDLSRIVDMVNFEIEDYDNIEDEVTAMFDSYSN